MSTAVRVGENAMASATKPISDAAVGQGTRPRQTEPRSGSEDLAQSQRTGRTQVSTSMAAPPVSTPDQHRYRQSRRRPAAAGSWERSRSARPGRRPDRSRSALRGWPDRWCPTTTRVGRWRGAGRLLAWLRRRTCRSAGHRPARPASAARHRQHPVVGQRRPEDHQRGRAAVATSGPPGRPPRRGPAGCRSACSGRARCWWRSGPRAPRRR